MGNSAVECPYPQCRVQLEEKDLQRHIRVCHRCPYCTKECANYEEVQVHVFTQCRRRPQDGVPIPPDRVQDFKQQPRPPPVVPARPPAVSAYAGPAQHNRSQPPPRAPLQPHPSHDGQRPNAVDTGRSQGSHADARPEQRVSVQANGEQHQRRRPVSEWVPEETLDDPEEKRFQVDDDEDGADDVIFEGPGAGLESPSVSDVPSSSSASAHMALAEAGSPEKRNMWDKIWSSAASLETFGAGDKAISICLEAAIHLLHRRPLVPGLIDDVLHNGVLLHPRLGSVSFQEVYIAVHRFTSQLQVYHEARFSTRDLSSFFEELPQLFEGSNRSGLAALLVGEGVGSTLLYFYEGSAFLFHPQAKVDDISKEERGASILYFRSAGKLQSYLLAEMYYVPIDDPAQATAYNSFTLTVLRLKSGVSFERRVVDNANGLSRGESAASIDDEFIHRGQPKSVLEEAQDKENARAQHGGLMQQNLQRHHTLHANADISQALRSMEWKDESQSHTQGLGQGQGQAMRNKQPVFPQVETVSTLKQYVAQLNAAHAAQIADFRRQLEDAQKQIALLRLAVQKK